MSSKNCIIIMFLLISTAYSNVDHLEKKVNTLNVLLPYLTENFSRRRIEYTLEAFAGCFEWQSSNSAVMTVENIKSENDKDGCYSSGKIKVIANNVQKALWVDAYDKLSGESLKIESRISKLVRIEILTKHRTIDLGDIQVLSIIGFDSEGNSFSSVEGLRFSWELVQDDNFIEKIQLKESHIKSSEIREEIESSGKESDFLVVKALKTGRIIVKASINEKGFEVLILK